ncbi:hypothetical protein [Nonomuraea sp. C10]|uniref:hypothetical protein n=1 Tax=Nonomuraea sp. C10 TaxID=2600577 RepID=UPI0011CE10FD|nr:hypothetical protein [Nonomuraea sp. C10]TXK41606.1 hypothetical protein FR742_20355 [Nonomuraea sp. C10]
MSTKSMEERVNALESWAFQTGRDLSEVKAVQGEHTNRLAAMDERLTGMDARLVRLEHGVGLLLDHHGIQRPQP